jgi:hypothetical protein
VEGQSSDFHAVISATPGDLSGDWLMVDVAPGAWDVTFTPKGMLGTGLLTLVITGSCARSDPCHPLR